jgi:hypothetical protein
MEKNNMTITWEEKILIQSIRKSGLPIAKVANELNNVYRETEHQQAFTDALKLTINANHQVRIPPTYELVPVDPMERIKIDN